MNWTTGAVRKSAPAANVARATRKSRSVKIPPTCVSFTSSTTVIPNAPLLIESIACSSVALLGTGGTFATGGTQSNTMGLWLARDTHLAGRGWPVREQGLPPSTAIAFYVLLGLGVVASSWLWAGLLQRHRGGRPMVVLNGLLALATAMLVVSAHPALVFASGVLFGAVFLSVVASTTALVRHNLPPAAWPGGITAFTIVFAFGQIAGPVAVGWVADGPGGLARGFVVSASALALGALLATRQRPVAGPGLRSPAPG